MKTREAYVDAVERLEKQRSRGRPIKDRPESLPLGDVKTAPEVFQPRMLYGGKNVDEHHVKSLRQALETGATLPPILVMRIGRHAYCVDGHHRLAAYKAQRKSKTVRVEWCEGTVKKAAQEALRRNIQDKLPMSKEAKLEAAWRMVVEGGVSKKEISSATSIATGTIGNMRVKLEALKKAGRADDFWVGDDNEVRCRLSWAEAKLAGSSQYEEREDWEELISDWAERLAKTFGKKWGQQPELAAAAIERFSERLPVKLVEVWREGGLLEDFDWETEE